MTRNVFVRIITILASITLLSETLFIYNAARTGRGLNEYIAAWLPAMLVACISVFIIALSRSRYLDQLDYLTEQHLHEVQETRSRLVKAAAHELRNPMTGLKGVLTVLRRRVNAGRPVEDWIGLIDIADNEINRMTEFLDDFVDAFHVQQGSLEIKASPVDMAQVLTNAIRPFIAVAADEGRSIVCSIKEIDQFVVIGDDLRLEQVIRNLVSNALKYSHSNGDVIVAANVKGDRLIISIQDFGMGISEKDMPHIFDCFYRVKSTAEKDPGGTGLGLYICQDIVQRHGGRIWAESELDAGTTFYVELPGVKQSAIAPPNRLAAEQAAAAKMD